MQNPENPMEGGSRFLRVFYTLAGVAYLLTAPLLAFFALMTPMACASGNCVELYANLMFFWTAAATLYALFIAIMAFAKQRTNPRWLTVSLMTFPFVFWGVYWLLAMLAGVT